MLHEEGKKNLDRQACWVSPPSLLAIQFQKNLQGQGSERFQMANSGRTWKVCAKSMSARPASPSMPSSVFFVIFFIMNQHVSLKWRLTPVIPAHRKEVEEVCQVT